MKISLKFYNPVQNHLANLMSGFVKPLSFPSMRSSFNPHPTFIFHSSVSCQAPALLRDTLEQKKEISKWKADFSTGIV